MKKKEMLHINIYMYISFVLLLLLHVPILILIFLCLFYRYQGVADVHRSRQDIRSEADYLDDWNQRKK